MNRNDFLILIFGIIVLLLAGGTFIAILAAYVRKQNKLVETGQIDNEILEEYHKEKRKSAKVGAAIARTIDLLICAVFATIVIGSIVANANGNQLSFGDAGIAKVVRSSSMANKREGNEYLFENDLNNQFDTYDIVFIKDIPDEMSLKLYDVVVYEKEGIEIIHRIIGIEEPNAVHPDCRWFTLKGDANLSADVRPVLYTQMTGIYVSNKIPFVGIFVLWMQSVLGYLILFAVLFYAIGEPIVSSKMRKIRDARIAIILGSKKNVDYPGSIPTVHILFHKYYLTDEKNYNEAKYTLEQFAHLLKLTKGEDLQNGFVYRDVTGNELVNENLMELYLEKNRNELIHIDNGDFIFDEQSNEKGQYRHNNSSVDVVCRHSLASRLLLSDRDVQYRFAEFSKVLRSYGAIEEKNWNRYIYKLKDVVLATIELEKQSETIKTESNPDIISNQDDVNVATLNITDDVIVNELDESGKDSIIYHGKELFVSYKRSFTAKLSQTEPTLKVCYDQIKNHLLSYGFKARMSWGCETFRKNSNVYCKISMRGKGLYVFLALDPLKFTETKYFYKDVSELKKYEMVPMLMKVRSYRGSKWVKELIDILANDNNFERNEKYEYTKFIPKYETTKQLIKNNLIKLEETVRPDFSKFGQSKNNQEFADEEDNLESEESASEDNSNE